MKSGLKIALMGGYFDWSGGSEFLRHIANGLLAKQSASQLEIYLFLPVNNKIERPEDLARVILRSVKGTLERGRPWLASATPAFHETILDFFQNTHGGTVEVAYYENSPAGLLRCLRRLQVDVALPVNGSLGRDFPIPWIGYMPDFQHKYLPGNFSPTECFNRDIQFATTLRDAKVAIVNSKAVSADIFSFFPYATLKVYNLPFSPIPVSEWFEDLPFDVRDKYSLPERFFLISNQFWIHKDHLTAFKALKSVDCCMVCTGTMADYRRPQYLAEIERFLADNDLSGHVKLLGHIPKRDQIEIMKKCVAVVQPTLFEGGPGGGSVYDAVSLGVPVIVSDIPVNKEVIAGNRFFFRAGDHEDLALKMRAVLEEECPRQSKDLLIEMGRGNLEKLGDCLLEAVHCVIQ